MTNITFVIKDKIAVKNVGKYLQKKKEKKSQPGNRIFRMLWQVSTNELTHTLVRN